MSADAPLSNSGAAVLGMVALGAQSGYDVRRAAERSLRFFWALGPPQIYSELRRLEQTGLLAGSDDARGRRPRRVFTVTDDGRAALHAWLTAGEPATMELRDGELLRLFFADALTPDEALARVAIVRERSVRALELFDREILPAAARTRESGAEFPELIAGFGRELHEFIVGWSERLEQQVATVERSPARAASLG